MLVQRYWDAIDDLFKKVRDTQLENIQTAGTMIADCIEQGGCIHLGPICHHMEYDLIYRGGGPIFYKHFAWKLDVESNVRKRDRSDMDLNMEGLAAYAIKASQMKKGDVLFLASVSGRTPAYVDLAYEAQKMGIHVIALTSMSYATQVDAVHSSGKKLYDMVDLAIDNCAPAAEAMMDVEGIEAKFGAASGIASDYIMWSITSFAVEELLKRGITPGILKSANFPGGNDYNKTVIEPQYEEKGY